jgi:hypothetical protein
MLKVPFSLQNNACGPAGTRGIMDTHEIVGAYEIAGACPKTPMLKAR